MLPEYLTVAHILDVANNGITEAVDRQKTEADRIAALFGRYQAIGDRVLQIGDTTCGGVKFTTFLETKPTYNGRPLDHLNEAVISAPPAVFEAGLPHSGLSPAQRVEILSFFNYFDDTVRNVEVVCTGEYYQSVENAPGRPPLHTKPQVKISMDEPPTPKNNDTDTSRYIILEAGKLQSKPHTQPQITALGWIAHRLEQTLESKQ